MAKNERPWQERLVTGLCWFVAVQLIVFGGLKFCPFGLFGYPSYPDKFVAWGDPPWFSFVIGASEVFAGVMLILRRQRSLGASVMLFLLPGAIATHIINRDALTDGIAAPLILVLAGIIWLASWPADWREPFALGARESKELNAVKGEDPESKYPGPRAESRDLSPRRARKLNRAIL